jgi:PKD repeat protein
MTNDENLFLSFVTTSIFMKYLYLIFGIVLFSLNNGFGQCSTAFTVTQTNCNQSASFSIDNVTAGKTYTWDFGYATPTVTGTNVPHTFPTISGGNTNTYQVTVSESGCNSNTNTTQSVIISQVPNAAFTYTGSSCSRQVNFTKTSPSSGYTYSWDFGDGSNNSNASPNHTFPLINGGGTNTYNVTLTVTSSCGAVSSSQNVVISQVPDAAFIYTVNSCSRQANFTKMSPSGGYTYSWDFGDGSNSSNASPNHTFPLIYGGGTNTYNVTLTVTSNCGTVSSSQNVVIDQKVVSGLQSKLAPNIPIDNQFALCNSTASSPTDILYVNDTSQTAGANNLSYNIDWGDMTPDFNGTNIPANLSHSYTSQGAFVLTLTVTGNNGCSEVYTYNVYNGNNPNVGLGIGTTISCAPGTFSFPISNTSNNPFGTIYTITVNDGTSPAVFDNSNLPGSYTYTFDSTSCGINSINFDDAYQVEIEASNACGSSIATVEPIRIYKEPDADFEILPDTNCAGSNFVFTNTSIAGNYFLPALGSCVNFMDAEWSITPNAGYNITSGSLTNVTGFGADFNVAGTYTIKLIVKNSSDGNSCQPDTIEKQICVVPLPQAGFSIASDFGCFPHTTAISNASNTLTACESSNYSWSSTFVGSDCGSGSNVQFIGGSNQNSENVTLQFGSSGVYVVTLVDSNRCNINTFTDTITVANAPQVLIAPILDYCHTATITPQIDIAATNTCYSPGTYVWDFSGGSPSTGTGENPGNITYSASNTPYVVTLTVTNSCGINSTTESFNVFPLPTLPNLSAQGNPYCATETIKLRANNPPNNISYNWEFEDGTFIDSIQNINIGNATTAMSGWYILTITDNVTGCQNIDSVQVNVTNLPMITIAGDTSICFGESTTLIGNGASTYEWNVGITSTNQSVTVSPNNDRIYQVIGTNGVGCIDSISVTVIVNPLPVVTATGPATTCVNAPTQLTGTGTTTAGLWSDVWEWQYIDTNGVFNSPNTGVFSSTYIYTDANGCADSAAYAICVLANPAANFTLDNTEICINSTIAATNTSNTLSGCDSETYTWAVTFNSADCHAGTGAFTFASGNASSQNASFNFTQSGVYTISLTAANNCGSDIKTKTITVVEPPQASIDTIPNFCATATINPTVTTDDCNGAISNYSWMFVGGSPNLSTSATPNNITYNSPGTYTVRVEVTNQCGTTTTTRDFIVHDLPTANVANNGLLCVNQNLELTTTITNSSTGILYSWATPNTALPAISNPTILNVVSADAGIYTVTMTDDKGCINTASTTVVINNLPNITATAAPSTICNGDIATLTGSGAGTNNYSWWTIGGSLITNTGTTVTANPIQTTVYHVIGTDANSCTDSNTVTVNVNQLPLINAGADLALCFQNVDTTLIGNPSSGTWSGTGITGAGVFNPSNAGLNGGNPHEIIYEYTDGNNCTNYDTIYITVIQPAPLQLNNDMSICRLTADFQLTASISGGTWSGSPHVTATGIFSPSAFGTHTVNYNVGTGSCAFSGSLTITVWELPTVNVTADNAICINDSRTLTASGDAATYLWSPSSTLDFDNVATVIATPIVTTDYTVIATDANACIDSNHVTVTVNNLPSVNAGLDQIICVNANTNLQTGASANPTGGNFTWSGDANINAAGIFNSSDTGSYTLTLTYTDLNSCINTDDVDLCVLASPNANFTVDNNQGCINTNNLNFTIQTTNLSNTLSGCDDATYLWEVVLLSSECDNLGAFSFVNGTTAADTTPRIRFTQSGVYELKLTVTNICGSNVHTENITIGSPPEVNIAAISNFCDNATINPTATISACDDPITTYAWTFAGADGTGISNQENPGAITYSTPGTYTVTLAVTNACGTTTDQTTFTIHNLPDINAFNDGPHCFGENLVIDVNLINSDVAIASYAWTGANTYSANGKQQTLINTTTINSGIYTVTVTDENGCIQTDTTQVNIYPLPIVTASPDVTICHFDSATLTVNGALTYVWSPNTGVSSTIDSIIKVSPPVGNTTYTVIGTDHYGCEDTDVVTVSVNPLPVVNAGQDLTLCNQAIGTQLIGTPTSGGTGVWSGTTYVSSSGMFTPSGMMGGTDIFTVYYIFTENGTNCTNVDSAEITVIDPPDLIVNNDTSVCHLTPNFILYNNVSGGTWTGTNVTAAGVFSPIQTGTFTLTYDVGTGSCFKTDNVTVIVTALPNVNITADDAICIGDSKTLTASGDPASYLWSPNATLNVNNAATVIATPTITTTYTVTATDANMCVNSNDVTVTVNSLPTVNAGINQTVCVNTSVNLQTGASGNPAGGTFTWSGDPDVSTAGLFNTSDTGSYTLLLTYQDLNGCIDTNSLDLCVLASPNANFSVDNNQGCINTNNPNFTIQTTNLSNTLSGCDDATYLWEVVLLSSECDNLGAFSFVNGTTAADTTPRIRFTQSGVYELKLTVTNICGSNVHTENITIGSPPEVNIAAISNFCDNATINPTATISACDDPITTYAWTFAGADGTGISNQENPGAITYSTPGTYTVTLAVTNACGTTTDQTTFTIYNLPVIDAFNDGPHCFGENLVIDVDLISSDVSIASYIWSSPANTYSATGKLQTITQATPANTGIYTVVATDNNGCIQTDTTQVVINALPTVIASNDVTICEEDSTTLTVSGASTYVWTPATGANTTTGANINVSPPIGNTTYTATGTDVNGCVNTDNVTVTVNPLPSVIAQSDIQLCNQNIPTQLTVTTTDVGTGVWSGSNYITSSGVFTPSGTPAGVDVYTVYYTFTITATGCINQDSVAVTVVDPTDLVLNNNTAVCNLTDDFTLTTSISGGTWSGQHITTAGVFTPSAVGVFTLTYQVGGGSCFQTGDVIVTVYALPNITLTPDSDICVDETITLNASGDLATYDWSPDSTLSANTGSSVIASPYITATYQVIATDANMCIDSSQMTVTVHNRPIVSAGTDDVVCQNTDLNLQTNATGTPTGGVYTWSGQNINTAGTFNSADTGTYTLTVHYVDNNTCEDSSMVDLCVLAQPIADFTVDNNAGCVNLAVQTTNISNTLNGCEDATYAWTTNFVSSECGNAGNVAFANGTTAADISPSFEFTESGIYEIILTVTNQCGTSTHTETITVSSPPQVAINTITNDCGTTTINPTANITACNGIITTYAWNFAGADGATASNLQTPAAVTYSNSGITYTVSLDVTNQCGTTNAQETFVLHNLPQITPSDNSPICFGETLELEVVIDTSDTNITNYDWSGPNVFTSNNQSDSIPNVTLAANGIYTIIVTDANFCQQTATTTAIINALPTVIASNDVTICEEDSTTLTVSGASTYVWTPATGANTTTGANINVSPPIGNTTYTATGTDVNGCVNTDNVTVTVNPLPSVIAQSDIQLCNQNIPTQLTVTTTDVGTGVWSGSNYITSSGVFTPSGTPAGVDVYTVYYTFTITATGCINQDSVAVTVVDPTDLVLNNNTAVCNLTDDFTLTTSISGGTWSGQHITTAGVFTPSTVGVFTLTYEVGGGSCFQTGDVIVTVYALPNITLTPDSDICVDESIPLDAGNTNNNPTTYDWSPDSTLSANIGLSVIASPYITAIYQVIATDVNMCIDSSQMIVTVHNRPIVSAGIDDVVCQNTNVNLQTNATGTPIGGNYTWSGQNINTAGIFNSADIGTYTLTVHYVDNNTCEDSSTVDLCVLAQPSANFTVDNNAGCVNLAVQTTNISNTLNGCEDATYAWTTNFVSSECGNTGNVVFANGTTAADISPSFEFTESGIYEIILTVTNQCGTSTHTEIITVASPPQVAINAITNDCGTTTINPTANITACNGIITTYAWNFAGADGATTSSLQTPPAVSYSNSGTTYTVSLDVTNQCGTTNAQETFVLHNLPQITPSDNSPICFDETLQLAVVIDTSDTNITNYAWSGPNGFISTNQNDSIPNVTLAANGIYTIIVTDANTCQQTATTTAIINALPTVIASNDVTICEEDSTTLTVSGASTYVWTPATGANTTTGANINVSPPVGNTTYTAIGTDVNGCVNSDDVIVSVNALPNIDAGGNLVLCNQPIDTLLVGTSDVTGTFIWLGTSMIQSDGTFTPTGNIADTGQYVVYYSFTNGITGCDATDSLTVTIIDPANLTLNNDTAVCNLTDDFTLTTSIPGGTWSGQHITTAGVFTPSTVGVFTLIYEVGGGSCFQTGEVIVTVYALPNITLTPDSDICVDETITLNASGDLATYDWSPDSTLSANIGSSVIASPYLTAIYQVIATDTNMCIDSSQMIVTVHNRPIVSAGIDDVVCQNTNVNLQTNATGTPIGGNYTWSGQNINTAGIFNSADTGTYTLTVHYVDNNTCEDSSTVDLCVLAQPSANFTVDNNVGCVNLDVQTTNVSNTLNGCEDATYAWTTNFVSSECGNAGNVAFTNGTTAADISPSFQFTESGIYEIILTVTNQCGTSTHTETITVSSPPQVAINTITNDCGTTTINPTANITACDGIITTYAWNFAGADGATTSNLQTPAAVTYSNSGTTYTVSLDVTNQCGTTNAQETFVLHNLPQTTPSDNSPICFDETLQLAVVIDTSDTNITNYAWSGPNGFISTNQNDSIPNVTLAANGIYTIIVTDANSCQQTATTTAIINPLPTIVATVAAEICEFDSTTLVATGGVSYIWSNNQNSITAIGSNYTVSPVPGTIIYTATGTDINGCVNSDTAELFVHQLPVVDAGGDTTFCVTADDILLVPATPSGGMWSGNGIVDGTLGTFNSQSVGDGTYTLYYTYTDGNTCTNIDSIIVNVTSPITPEAGNNDTICIYNMPLQLTGFTPTTGGTWTGTGVTTAGVFDPSIPGVGVTWLYYSYGGGTCENTDSIFMYVAPYPQVEAGQGLAYCVDADADTLQGYSPNDNGIWSGEGIIDSLTGVFSPSIAETQTLTSTPHQLTYTYTDPFTGCQNFDTLTMTVHGLPVVNAGIDTVICNNPNPTDIVLNIPTVQSVPGNGNGIWTGIGITNPIGIFRTDSAGGASAIPYLLTYTYTDDNGCINFDTINAYVGDPEIPVAFPYDTVCALGLPFVFDSTLYEPNIGVTFIGQGVTNSQTGEYDPSILGDSIPVGGQGVIDTIIMRVGEGTCQTFDTTYIFIAPTPTVEAGSDNTYCVDWALDTLTGYLPDSSGYWTGAGIIDSLLGVFNPGLANDVYESGSYQLTYTYIDPFTGCTNFDTLTQTVNRLPSVNAGLDTSYCDNPNPIDIGLPTPNPLGGYWMGIGVVDGANGLIRTDLMPLTPPVNGVLGSFTMTYTYTDSNTCINYDSLIVTVTDPIIPQAFPYDTVCAYDLPFIFDATTYAPNIGVTFIGQGVTNSQTGEYDPSILGDSIPVGGQGVIDTIIMRVGQGTCQTFDTTYIFIAPTPTVEAGSDNTYCVDWALDTLIGYLPDSSGYWTGAGIIDSLLGVFNPGLANDVYESGSYQLTYTYIDPFTGCTNFDTLTQTVNRLPSVNAGLDTSYCDNPNPIDIGLPTPNPLGGYWMGIGVVDGANGLIRTDLMPLTPPVNGVLGSFTMTYTYTDSNTCINYDSLIVTVTDPIIPQAFPYDTVCAYDLPFIFDTATYAPNIGVTFIGQGITNSQTGEYDPSILGDSIPVGGQGVIDTIIMRVGEGTCQTFDTTYIFIAPTPTVEAGSDITFCEEDSLYILTGYTPDSSGIWFGLGIVDSIVGVFSPTVAGTDILMTTLHILTYVYIDPFTGCQNSDSLTATIHAHPLVEIFDTTVCANPIPTDIILDAPVVQSIPNGGNGIWTGPGIVDAFNGIFRTDSAGVIGFSPYFVVYTYTDLNGCTTSDTARIDVTIPEIPVAFSYDTVCIYDAPFLFDSTLYEPNIGITWSGMGIANAQTGEYNPGLFTIPVGGSGIVDMIIMSIGQGTCQTFDTTYIFIAPTPAVDAGMDLEFCADEPLYTLTGYTPDSSGTWSGYAIDDPIAGIYNPSIDGIYWDSVYNIIYTYTDPFTGCMNNDSLEVTINDLPVVYAGPDTSYCLNPNPLQIQLYAGTPAGGFWTGPNLTNNILPLFLPDTVGVYTLYYNYTNAEGCANLDSVLVTVVEPVLADATGDTLCYDGGINTLLGIPAGGIWDGNGIIDQFVGSFDPIVANDSVHGTGVHVQYTNHQIIYEYGVGTCQTFDTVNVLVIDMTEVVEAGADEEVCDSVPPYNLTGFSPLGGWWEGPGITNSLNGTFDPAFATPDTHTLTYYYYDPIDSCLGFDTKEIIVNPLPGASFVEIPVACISGPIQFDNTSDDLTAFFYWDFGDSTTSFDVNPLHTYQDTGRYTIKLIATSVHGCIDSFISNTFITEPPTAFFTPDTTEGCAVLPIDFTNFSYGYQPTYYWDFGNGDTSTLYTPPTIFFEQGEWDTTYYVQLNVTNLCGTVYHLDSILVHPIPIVRFATNLDTACSPMIVHFANVSVGNPANFQWFFGDGTTSTDSIPPPHTYYADTIDQTYTITLISTNECGADTLQRYVTVLPNNVNAFFVPDVIVGCQPLTVDFISLSSGINIVHNWEFGDGNTSNMVNPVHTFDTTGIFPVKLRIDNGCGYDTMVINITVYPIPDVSFVHNDSICEGDVINFVNTSPAISGQLWQFGDGDTSILTNPSHPYDSVGNYTVYLTGYAVNTGCPGYDSSIVTVIPQPTSTFTSSVLDGCVPLTVDFTNTGVGADYADWTFGDGNSSVVISPTHTFTAAGTYGICLVNTSINGCVSDTTCIQIIVHPKPVSAFMPVITDTCGLPLTVDFVNQSTGAIGYYWDFSNGSTSVLNNPTTMYQDTGIHVIGMIAVNQFNCADTSYRVIRAFENPVANFTYTPAHGCEPPLPVTFTNTSSYYNNSSWNFGNGGSVQDSPTHPYNALGSYTVSLIVGYDGICFDTVTVVDAVNVTPNPVANFEPIITDTCGVPLRVDFINSSTGAINYRWDFGDNALDSILEPTHLYNNGGYYEIMLVAYTGFGCTDTTVQTIRAIDDPIADFSLNPQFGCTPLVVEFENASQFANQFEWSFGDGSVSFDSLPNHTYVNEGVFDVTLTISMDNICFDEMVFPGAVEAFLVPIADFDFTEPNIDPNDGTVIFENLSSLDAVSFQWLFGDGGSSTLENPTHRYYVNGLKTITLIVKNSLGCIDTIEKVIEHEFIKGLFVPNAFTPEVGPGLVRVFKPGGVGLKRYNIQVFTMWGELLWASDELEDGRPIGHWDGTYQNKPMPQGAYIWKVDAEFLDGSLWEGMTEYRYDEVYNENSKRTIGTVSLIR